MIGQQISSFLNPVQQTAPSLVLPGSGAVGTNGGFAPAPVAPQAIAPQGVAAPQVGQAQLPQMASGGAGAAQKPPQQQGSGFATQNQGKGTQLIQQLIKQFTNGGATSNGGMNDAGDASALDMFA